jgi:hypothetical protein
MITLSPFLASPLSVLEVVPAAKQAAEYAATHPDDREARKKADAALDQVEAAVNAVIDSVNPGMA